MAALARTKGAASNARRTQARARQELSASTRLLAHTEAVVIRARATRSEAIAAETRARRRSEDDGRRTAERAVRVAELRRDDASDAVDHDRVVYDTANAIVAETRAAAARAEGLRAAAAISREHARTTVAAAIATRQQARAAHEAARLGLS